MSFPPGCQTCARRRARATRHNIVDKYGYRDELQDIAAAYRDNQMQYDGKIYGFPDDGDVMILYYRKDIFEDPKMKEEFKAKFGYDLHHRRTGTVRSDRSVHHRQDGAQDLWRGLLPYAPYPQYMFQERFRMEGGKFFDANTMKATVNSEVGVKVLRRCWRKTSSCLQEFEQWNFVDNLAAFLQGTTAMTISWPPYGRWAAGYGTSQEALKLGTEVADRRESRLRAHSARSARACRRFRPVDLRRPARTRKPPICSSSGSTARRPASSVFNCPTPCAIRSGPRIMRARRIGRSGQMRQPISTP